jgi:hypothetical protein
MNREKWISEVLQSAKDIQPVASNPYMATRIEAKLQEIPPVSRVPLRWVLVSVTIMLTVLVLNVTIWNNSVQKSKADGLEQLIHEYGFANNDFYSMNYPK